ncbi:MAG: HAD family phosphatase [Candidatus Omnitrophica bacterium]|nr:HAD family phosphatase [Candidatus Omnitrophota bacterium]
MTNIKAIFFDLGKVVVQYDVKTLVKGYSKYAKMPGEEELGEYMMKSYQGMAYMTGRMTSSVFYTRTKKYFKMRVGYNNFYEVWNSMFFHDPEMEKYMRDIKAKYPELVFILVSDTNPGHFEFIQKEYPILELMDHFVLSYEIGELKPDPKMYTTALRLAKVLPKEAVYFDDRADLIKSARSMGIRAFQFTTCESARTALVKLGIEV